MLDLRGRDLPAKLLSSLDDLVMSSSPTVALDDEVHLRGEGKYCLVKAAHDRADAINKLLKLTEVIGLCLAEVLNPSPSRRCQQIVKLLRRVPSRTNKAEVLSLLNHLSPGNKTSGRPLEWPREGSVEVRLMTDSGPSEGDAGQVSHLLERRAAELPLIPAQVNKRKDESFRIKHRASRSVPAQAHSIER